MNIIRAIKIKILINEDSFDEKEKFLYSLFNDIRVVEDRLAIYIVVDNNELSEMGIINRLSKHFFHYHLKSHNLWCCNEEVLIPLREKFGLSDLEISNFIINEFKGILDVNSITSSIKLDLNYEVVY